MQGGMTTYSDANRKTSQVKTWRELNPDAAPLWRVQGADLLYEGDSELEAWSALWNHATDTTTDLPCAVGIYRMGNLFRTIGIS